MSPKTAISMSATGNSTSWTVPPESLALKIDEVHIWRAPLDAGENALERYERFLSSDERERAERFIFQKHRRRFIVARAVLRLLLGRYLNQEPDRIRFVYGPEGKPALADTSEGCVQFNLSHSEALALYAFTRGREVGIDLEWMNPRVAFEELAERFFTSGEASTLRTLPDHAREPAFFACWTRKEAYMKAIGKGLSLPTQDFEVSLAPGEPAALISTRHDPDQLARWSLLELDAGPGFAAALAVEGRGWNVQCWQWYGLDIAE
jgi:4'-phosphopantetheinyl transferase